VRDHEGHVGRVDDDRPLRVEIDLEPEEIHADVRPRRPLGRAVEIEQQRRGAGVRGRPQLEIVRTQAPPAHERHVDVDRAGLDLLRLQAHPRVALDVEPHQPFLVEPIPPAEGRIGPGLIDRDAHHGRNPERRAERHGLFDRGTTLRARGLVGTGRRRQCQ
jgi:hypothetical protein